MEKELTLRGAIRLAMMLFASAAVALCISSACAAQSQDLGSQNFSEEYKRIELAYSQVAKYYNGALTDAEAVYVSRCILYYSGQFKIDPRLVVALIVAESRFKPKAVSPKGAQGLGQLMPGTARYLGVTNAFDIQQNVYGTVKYLRAQYDRWQSNPNVLEFMLAAYNAGPEAVAKCGGIPPYAETRNYVSRVTELYRYFVHGQ